MMGGRVRVPCPSTGFDVVTMVNMLHHIDEDCVIDPTEAAPSLVKPGDSLVFDPAVKESNPEN